MRPRSPVGDGDVVVAPLPIAGVTKHRGAPDDDLAVAVRAIARMRQRRARRCPDDRAPGTLRATTEAHSDSP